MTVFNANSIHEFPLAPEHCVTGFGKTLIVVPHADDESLGCGGIIALMRSFGQEVYILLLSDGTLSHPNSLTYPSEKLRDLREQEFTKAAAELQVPANHLIFARFKDGEVPNENSENFQTAVDSIFQMLDIINPQTIFVTWRRDPHPDHRAAYQLIQQANKNKARLYEYPVWLYESAEVELWPTDAEIKPFRVDIARVLRQKQRAIAQHKSQTTKMITDDPAGFMLSHAMLERFDVPYETFFIAT